MTREADIERPASAFATLRGWFQIKIERASKRGFPDRFYARGGKDCCPRCGRGRVVLVEYKAPGEQPSEQQRLRHAELRAAGVEVHVIDNAEEAIALLR